MKIAVIGGTAGQTLRSWAPMDSAAGMAASVAWHLAHPPVESPPDLSADGKALG